MKYKLISLVLAAVIVFTLNPLPIAAQSGKVSVYPSRASVSAIPGKKVRKTVMIVNTSGKPVYLKVSVSDFKITDESGKVEFYENENWPAEKWLVPQYETVFIPALDSERMEYLVSVKNDMPGQGYAGAVIFQEYNPESQELIGTQFGTLVTLNVLSEGITTGGTITSFSAAFLQFKDPLDFSFTVENSSNSNLSLAGDIIFTNLFGKELKKFETGRLEIYPGQTKDFQYRWGDNPLFGVYLAKVRLVDNLREDNVISSSGLIIFLPWQKLLVALAVILFAVFGIMILSRRYDIKNLLFGEGSFPRFVIKRLRGFYKP